MLTSAKGRAKSGQWDENKWKELVAGDFPEMTIFFKDSSGQEKRHTFDVEAGLVANDTAVALNGIVVVNGLPFRARTTLTPIKK